MHINIFLQTSLRELAKIGTRNWEKKTSSRDMYSRGEYIPVQDYINKVRLNIYIYT